MNLPINEIFHSVQGEGSYTGTPSVFVRLQYCPILCPFCDTKHTWEKFGNNEISFDMMLAKTVDAPTWADVDVYKLVGYLKEQPEKHIVITGGEPCVYDLWQITSILIEYGKTVQIETSGTFEIRADDSTFITLSPKINMPGGLKVLNSAAYCADEVKMPVGKQKDVETLKEFLTIYKTIKQPMVYLQPLSQSEKATELCIEQARLNGWRLSAQLHKFLRIR
jgi:7-carboxy-7-deazaguanine synthase